MRTIPVPDRNPVGGNGQVGAVPIAPLINSVKADEVTRQGVTLHALSLTDLEAMLSQETLKNRAEKLAQTLHYLSESLGISGRYQKAVVALNDCLSATRRIGRDDRSPHRHCF